MPVFSREHIFCKFYYDCPLSSHKRHKIRIYARSAWKRTPNFVPVRHEIGPLLRRNVMCLVFFCAQRSVWHASLPRVKHKRGTLAVKTMAGKILVTLAVKMKVESQRLSWGHLRTQRWQKSSAHWRLKRGVVAWKTCLFTLKRPGWHGSELMPVAKRANSRTSAVSLTLEVRHGRVCLLCSE